jgi:hypothetical protein
MIIYDYNSYETEKSSLYYRWKPYDLPSIRHIIKPNIVFNSEIEGCLSMGTETSNSFSSGTICKYKVGESIQIKNKTIILANPFRDEYITYKVGRISKVLPLNVHGECYYNILFDDNTEGLEVSEKYIQRYYEQSPLLNPNLLLNNKSTIANLALLNNLNQTISKSNSSLLSNLNQTVG